MLQRSLSVEIIYFRSEHLLMHIQSDVMFEYTTSDMINTAKAKYIEYRALLPIMPVEKLRPSQAAVNH